MEKNPANSEIAVKSPLTNKEIGTVIAMTPQDVDVCIERAKKAYIPWKNTPLHERAKILYDVADLLIQKEKELTELLVLEIGKDRKSAKSEVTRTAEFIRFTADVAKSMQGETIQSDRFPGYENNKISLVTREPLGVVLAISPFNYPVNLAASKIAPALIVGNTVVFKPATSGCLSGKYLAQIFHEAGVPTDALVVITGKGSEIGDYVVTHEKIDFINFTGSTEVGRHISQITCMVPVMMELGGKDAAIVLKDADLELAASNIVAGAYSYSGQRCTAVKRILVEEGIADVLVEKLKEKIEKLSVGDPLTQDVTIVPLISRKAADYVSELMQEAIEKGANLVVGGKREDNLIDPTLYDYVTTDMRLAWEEPFGPILPVIRVKDMEEAIQIANASQYGLQSSIFTETMDIAFYIASRLEVGTVQINNKTERGPDHFPFMGVKASGLGTQGIRYSIETMTRPKATVLNLRDPNRIENKEKD